MSVQGHGSYHTCAPSLNAHHCAHPSSLHVSTDTYTRGHFLPKFLVSSILTGLRNPAYDRLVAMEVIKLSQDYT